MTFRSTRKRALLATFQEALYQGQASDGGLFMPSSFPRLEPSELKRLSGLSYQDLATDLALRYLGDEIGEAGMHSITTAAYPFAPALHPVTDGLFCLELFHGPTFSFKDFGAQFMAKAMGHFAREAKRRLTILVATSGDTGSAVAHAYHHLEGIRIVLLYPSGKVSPLQEKQFTTLGDNVQALEIQGTFDDCQAMVKRAFADEELSARARLSSANSINIGRLIPQSFYYVWAVLQARELTGREVIVCVPSGNFGNLTAGFFAKRMGLPIVQFIAAVNANTVVPEYLQTGEYRPRPSIRTYSNAMDVGAPSNWERIRDLCNDDYHQVGRELWSTSVDDPTILATMRRVNETWGYVIDPHTAVGFEAVSRYRAAHPVADSTTGAAAADHTIVTLSTAHPAKFTEVVELALGRSIELPEPLRQVLAKEKQVTVIPNEYRELKEYLWDS